MHTLKICDLCVSADDRLILNKFCLSISSGEIHVIMGPNGTGKSTLSKVIMGDSNYKIVSGSIYFDDKDITSLSVDERSRLGIFLGMQMPLEIDGVSNSDFLRSALHNRNSEFKLYDFIKKINKTVDDLGMSRDMIHRGINQGFSGGERKKNEILQMYMLEPNTILLDEIDSGLDVDSLRVVGESVMKYYDSFKPSILLITHYQRLLDYIKPHFVHIMKDGHIVRSGDASLVGLIEKYGYDENKILNSTDVVEENGCHE